MIKRRYLISLLGLISIIRHTNAQPIANNKGSIENRLGIKEGIFLTHDDFLHNKALEVSKIKTTLDTSSVDFYFELFKNKEIEYLKDGSLKQTDVKTIFGYFDGKGVYVNLTRLPSEFGYLYVTAYTFSRVDIFGQLSIIYFAKQRIDLLSNYRFSGLKNNADAVDGVESKAYCLILNFPDGKAYNMNKKNLEYLLSDDQELQKEYKRSKEDEDIKPFIFIGKYNKRHPFEFK